MPSQAETIAALQGLNPVTTPQSPADPYAAAMTFGSAIGLPDAIKALKGQLTPEEAQMFAVTSAMGMIPGAAPEKAAVKTMGGLLPHLYPEASSFAKMTPKEYLGMFGSDLPKQLPQDVENVLKPYMQPAKTGKVPGPGPVQQFGPANAPLDQISSGHQLFKMMTGPEKDYILANHGDTKMSDLPGLVAKIKPQLDAANLAAKAATNAPSTTATGALAPNTLKQVYESAWANGQHPLVAIDEHVKKLLGNTNSAEDVIDNAHNDFLYDMNPMLNKKYGHWADISDKNEAAKAGGVSQADINKALAKNPGASIFDVANTHVGGQSSPLSSAMGNAGLEQTFPYSQTFGDISREGGIPYTPIKASILGKSENLVHGTRVPQTKWHGEIGSPTDALKLPDDELGVHFGNPKQAQVFSGDWLSRDAQPRQYPVVVATNNPLELPDMGTWHLEDITRALKKANAGELRGKAGFERQPDNPGAYTQISPETVGQFPPHELSQIDSIEGMRDYLQSKGYDSVKYVNKAEDAGANSFIKFTGSPEAPNFVTGVRSPWAAFDPSKIMRPELAAGLAGGTLAAPAIDPNLLKALTGGQTDQQQ